MKFSNCKKCSLSWNYIVSTCPHCLQKTTQKEINSDTKILSETTVNLASTHHQDIPYTLQLVQKEEGIKELRKK